MSENSVSHSVNLTASQRATAHMAASVLLDYPTEERRAQFELVAAHAAELPEELAAEFGAFFDAVGNMDEGALQAHFTSIFDQKRKCCPYLTYYATGDTRKRGMALVSFVDAYRAAGWELEEGELPDYLPLFFEYLATRPRAEARALIAEIDHILAPLEERLSARGSPYAAVFTAIRAIAGATTQAQPADAADEP
ncbi:MAG TPA: nitrate reductase molybdenum cofactor assembly chaperone, partial [Terrimesophilobacter sp.]|nr:nitrate reductase molybdenum cofactor assembly chaperone [Terrimesophilobacter sp.]